MKALYNLLHVCALKRGVFLLGESVRVFGGCVGVRALRVALIE
ncbi:Pkinase-domain-containing protein [Acetobacter orientalis]|uniref:Pkinase-domain-containing protein n=1 Tax=Acetobacter orientalis TaxID=146474 RepID=A0A2Z5ZFV3_9PROT|nr:Pkinase-domain-containing protein [Acetobacter orientalis]